MITSTQLNGDDSIILNVQCGKSVVPLRYWINEKDIGHLDPEDYPTGWYYCEEDIPFFCGKDPQEAARNVRLELQAEDMFPSKAHEDLLYALSVLVKRMDQNDKPKLEEAFLSAGYTETEVDKFLDLAYSVVLE